ncbi:MAG: hypothetical protein AB4057_01595 [Crocosphaera sp.]
MSNQNLKIFLASSSELKEDRDQFEIFINRQNKKYIKQGIFLELVIWEDFLDAMSRTRLQDEYNKAIKECDLFVSLFNTKVGQYTEEEVMIAWEAFKENNKPLIYTYFKESQINVSQANIEQLQSLEDFKRKLRELGHFYTKYNNIEDLKYKFSEQLNKFLPELVETENNVNNTTRLDSMEEQKSRQAINVNNTTWEKFIEKKQWRKTVNSPIIVATMVVAIIGIWQPWKTRITEIELAVRVADPVIFRVVNAQTNKAVSGAAVVLLTNGDIHRQVTDSFGITKFSLQFPDGKAESRISVETIGYKTNDQIVTFLPNTVQDVRLDPESQTIEILPISPEGTGQDTGKSNKSFTSLTFIPASFEQNRFAQSPSKILNLYGVSETNK